jgi:hypothetical protein
MNEPKSFKDALFGADDVRQNMDSVECGGWANNTNATVQGQGVSGDVPIPEISKDLPGRENVDPLVRPITGIGERGDFEFPDSTTGYLSACDLYAAQMHDADLEKLGIDLKMNGNPGDPSGAVSVDVVPGTGEIDINPHQWCIRYDKATPGWCKKLHEWYLMLSAAAPRPARNAFCDCPADACYCPADYAQFDKHYCFDEELTTRASGYPVTKECTGQECRVWTACGQACCPPTMPEFGNELIKCEWGVPQFDADGNFVCQNPSKVWGDYEWAVAASYYRHYSGAFRQPNISVTQDGGAKTWKVRAECYEYYKENDPRECVTSIDDDQCEFVIATPDEQSPDKPEWVPGNGHTQKEQYRPDPAMVAELPRNPRDVPEPWVADTETNLNLIDAKKLAQKQQKMDDPYDLSAVASVILPAKQRAAKNMPDNARTDMYDDTAERTVGEYWEEQQKELMKMLAEPTAKVVMPVRSFMGMSLSDPIYQFAANVISRSDGIVEITLKAGLEDMGQALRFFVRNLMTPIHEVRIPLIVPLISEEEINTRIFEWRQWQEYENRSALVTGRTSYASDADPLIARLQQYLDVIRKERLLRGATVRYLQRLFDVEEQIYTKIADWFLANASAIQQAQQAYQLRAKLKCVWRMVQQSMLQTDECQLEWCSNQRYSAPVYSLLDEWWGDMPAGSQRNHAYKPPKDLRTLGYHQQEDIVFDFSHMGFSSGGILFPVLWPVQAKVALPIPPAIGEKPDDPSLYPVLPTLPDETVFDPIPVPNLHMPTLPTMIGPAPVGPLNQAIETLKEFREMVDGTPAWVDMYPETGCDSTTTDQGPWSDRASMRGTYCRLQPSIIIPPDPTDAHGKADKIVHVENDLKERLARLFSRWMPNRMEDFAGRTARFRTQFPNPALAPCREDVPCASLQPETTTITIWQWYLKGTSDAINALADTLKNLTLPPSDNENPYLDAPLPILKRLFRNLDLPIEVQLIPGPPPPP